MVGWWTVYPLEIRSSVRRKQPVKLTYGANMQEA